MDLFSNPMINNAVKALTPEQLNDYKKLGQSIYGNVNFVDSKIIGEYNKDIDVDSVAYIEEGLKAGILPEDLEESEIQLLNDAYGNKWYEKYGFSRDEVPEPGLNLQLKKHLEKIVEQKISKQN